MKKLKYILIFILSIGLFNSCLIDDGTTHDDYDQGPNLAGFLNSTRTVAGVSDGSEYTFELPMMLEGPTSMDITNDIALTIGVDESSTAIEGTHYRIDNSSITLEAANDHLAIFEFTMLTDGILAPLDKAPVLVLEVLSASGDPNVLNNGKKINITLSYQCYSDLAGDYYIDLLINGATRDPFAVYGTNIVTITRTGVGAYRTDQVGHWAQASLGGNPGYTFYDECNKITVPHQDLVDTYSNWVEGLVLGDVDPETGIISIEYIIDADSWSSANTYTNTYTPVD